MPHCNNTLEHETVSEVPVLHGLTFHELGLILSATFALIALIVSGWLILMHATHYLKPVEQRHIIRILLLIPIYSVVSFLSFYYYKHAIYFTILEGFYEAFAISSFFTLLCQYIAPTLHDQKDYFRGLKPKNWFWKFFGLQYCTGGENKGLLRKPRSGLTWFNVIWVGVFQYCVIRVVFSIVAVLAQIGGVYCQASLSPEFAHVWVDVFESVSVTIAMFCLVQFYIQLKDDLAEYKPGLKLLCIKLVVFFSFWQTIIISFLTSSHGPLRATKTIAYPDFVVGIPSLLLCIEMAIFAVMHTFAFPWKPYSIKHSYSNPTLEPGTGYGVGGGNLRYAGFFHALIDAFNPWDIVKMTARGIRWLFVGVRKRHDDVSYQDSNLSKTSTRYGPVGTSYSGSQGPATELSESKDDARGRSNTFEDDRAGLLTHQGQMGRRGPSSSPYRPYAEGSAYSNAASGDSQVDLSMPPPNLPARPSGLGISRADAGHFSSADTKPSELDDDTGYHPGGATHPAYRHEDPNWPLSNDMESTSGSAPPAYQAYRPQGDRI